MRVALVQVPMPSAADPLAVAPLGIGYVAAAVRKHLPNVQVDLVNLAATPPEEATEVLAGYDVYGYTCSSIDYQWAELLRDDLRKREPEARQVIGGPHVTASYSTHEKELLDPLTWDAVFVGEGEETFVDYLRNPKRSAYFTDRIEDLDALAFPVRNLLVGGKLLVDGSEHSAAVFASRGCPYNCACCCSSAVWGREVRYRSPANVAEEIQQLCDEYGVRDFWFADDRLPGSPARRGELLERLGSLGVRWRASIRANEVSVVTLRDLKAGGCAELAIGAESFDDEVLAALNKRCTAEQNEAAVILTHEAGITVRLLMMVGTPGETPSTAEKNVAVLRRLEGRFHRFVLSTFMPMPGCAVRRDPVCYGVEVLEKDPAKYDIRLWSKNDPATPNPPLMLVRILGLTEEQQQANLVAMRGYALDVRRRLDV